MPFDVLFDTAPNSSVAMEAEFYLITEDAVGAVMESVGPDLIYLLLPEVDGPFQAIGRPEALEALRAHDADIAMDRHMAEAVQVAERAWRDWRKSPAGARDYDDGKP
jgi:hypothetical protein